MEPVEPDRISELRLVTTMTYNGTARSLVFLASEATLAELAARPGLAADTFLVEHFGSRRIGRTIRLERNSIARQRPSGWI
jgi:hypothetical protein